MGDFNMGGRGQGVVLLISNIPEQIANVDNIFNMVGMYGDVMFVKILRNKLDCAMVQMAKPHHAQQVKQCLDHAKIGGNKLCVSFSRVDNLLNKRRETSFRGTMSTAATTGTGTIIRRPSSRRTSGL